MAPRLNILGHAACGWKLKVFSSGGKHSRWIDWWRFANRGKLKAIANQPMVHSMLQLTLCCVLGLSDKVFGEFGFLARHTSVCVACVFITLRFCFSMLCASKDWFIGCIDSGGCENVWWSGGFCKIVCIWIICGICCSGGGCWVIVSVGFLPPINLSWLLALYIRVLPFRIPIASSNDARVRERAKLTCLVLWTIKQEKNA